MENEESCKYHMTNFGPDDERTKQFCGDSMNEGLKGRQRKLDKNKNNKIDSEDFKLLRKEKKGNSMKFKDRHGMEEQETEEGNAFSGALSDAKKSGKDSFEVDGKKYPVKESVRMNERELINLIEKIVLEQKSTNVKDPAEKNNLKTIGSAPGLEKYKQVHKKDGKENEDNIKAVAQKMKDYLKDGSKAEYDTNPKIFPKGNGELAKMSKKAYVPSGAVEDYIDNFTAAALEN